MNLKRLLLSPVGVLLAFMLIVLVVELLRGDPKFFRKQSIVGPDSASDQRQAEQTNPFISYAKFTPDGQGLVIACHYLRNRAYLLSDISGRVAKVIHRPGEGVIMGKFDLSPDGTRMVREYGPDWLHRDLALVDLTAGTLEVLTHTSLNEHAPAFSSDGRGIYFAQAKSYHSRVGYLYGMEQNALYHLDLATRRLTQLVPHVLGGPVRPQPFPDGNSLFLEIYEVAREAEALGWSFDAPWELSRFWIFNLNSPHSPQPILPDLKQFRDRLTISDREAINNVYLKVRWGVLSRDGSSLVYWWRRNYHDGYGKKLYLTDMVNMATQPLAHKLFALHIYDIAPDNSWVAFWGKAPANSSPPPLASNLWLVRPDGSGLRNLTLDFSALGPEWSPAAAAGAVDISNSRARGGHARAD